jgi:cation diffusion facilitator family transporter
MTVSLHSYVHQVRRVLWITLGINVTVVLVKILLGITASSLAIISDAAHSSVDSLNNIMGLLVMRLVRPYADEEHPYGHAKYEVVGALGIAAFMVITVFEIVSNAVTRLISGVAYTRVTVFTVVVFSVTLLANIFVVWYETTQGKRLNSQFLIADVRHTVSDLYITGSIIIGLVFVTLGVHIMDTIPSLVVALVVAITAYHVVRDAVPVLVDEAVIKPVDISQTATEVSGVEQVKNVRTRGAGPGCFIELTIQVETNELKEAHAIADDVEHSLHDHFGPDCTVTVHVEPDEEQ